MSDRSSPPDSSHIFSAAVPPPGARKKRAVEWAAERIGAFSVSSYGGESNGPVLYMVGSGRGGRYGSKVGRKAGDSRASTCSRCYEARISRQLGGFLSGTHVPTYYASFRPIVVGRSCADGESVVVRGSERERGCGRPIPGSCGCAALRPSV